MAERAMVMAIHQWAALALIPAYLVGVGIARLLDLIQQPNISEEEDE